MRTSFKGFAPVVTDSILVALSACGLLGFGALPAWAVDKAPVIEAIESAEGESVAVVKAPSGASRPAERGMEIRIGERVKTGPKTSVKIRYPDGSKLLVGRGTELEVQEHNGATQYNQVYNGYVRGLIRKASAPAPGSPPRFVVRSRTVVMGVRGTDFLLNLSTQQAEQVKIHTLNGTVEVAKDEASLLSGQGVSVAKDQMIEANGMSLTTPTPFDARQFQSELSSALPEFSSLAARDAEAVRAAHEIEPSPEAIREFEQRESDQLREKQAIERAEQFKEELKKQKPAWQPEHLQFSGMGLVQTPKSRFLSAGAAWSPYLHLFWIFGFRGSIGVFPVKSRDGDGNFVALEITGHPVIALFWNRILLEPGVSWQRWGGGKVGRNADGPIAQVSIPISEDGRLERIFASYSQYRGLEHWGGGRSAEVHVLKLGVGIRF